MDKESIMDFIIGETVIVDVRDEHDREEMIGVVGEIDDYVIKVVFPSGYWQWTHYKKVRRPKRESEPHNN